ncbi:MAG TPA: hypothetical protein VHA33_11035 [Candidatus Angelobacter sp.]|jgi:hypothetical protein|nr:hypothetical protein [Candidatus Angelobacter sp.]
MIKTAIRSGGRADILAELWNALRDEREKLLPYVGKAKSYRNECGCTMGGVFAIGALMLLILRGIFFTHAGGGHWHAAILQGTAFVFGACMLGKGTGIGIARIRLGLLYRDLRLRYHSEGK